MKRKTIIVYALISMLIATTAGTGLVSLAKANFIAYCTVFTINSDGTITPPTSLIQRNGNTYYLTSSTANCAFTIQRSNIVFDGQGYTMNGGVAGFGYSNVGLYLNGVQNVIVKDVTTYDFWADHFVLTDCTNCTLLRVHTTGPCQSMLVNNSCYNTISQSTTYSLTLTPGSNNNLVAMKPIRGFTNCR